MVKGDQEAGVRDIMCTGGAVGLAKPDARVEFHAPPVYRVSAFNAQRVTPIVWSEGRSGANDLAFWTENLLGILMTGKKRVNWRI
jgi:hypothetical protein